MDMISDTGAITDVNEITAALETEITPEELEAAEKTSLEELVKDLSSLQETVSELPDEEQDMLSFNPALESLGHLLAGIRQSGGISRSDVVTLSQMTASLEGFENVFSNMPLASFTELPSKVNYSASMENMVSAFFRKVVEAIKKFIQKAREVMRDFFKRFSSHKVQAEKLQVASKKASEKIEKSEKADEPFRFKTTEFCQWFVESNNGQKFADLLKEGAIAISRALSTGDLDDVVFIIGKIAEHVGVDGPKGGFDIAVLRAVGREIQKRESTHIEVEMPSRKAYNQLYLTAFSNAYNKTTKPIYDIIGRNSKVIDDMLKKVDSVIRTDAFLKAANADNYSVEENEQYQTAVVCYDLMEMNDFIGRMLAAVNRGQLNIISRVLAA